MRLREYASPYETALTTGLFRGILVLEGARLPYEERGSVADQAREVLEQLVLALTTYNQQDMLGGYLNQLAEEFNQRLEALGLPTLDYVEADD